MRKQELVYVSIPYTWDPEKSFEIANKVSAELMKQGRIVFSPISMGHPIANYLNPELRCNQEFWMNQDLSLLDRFDTLIVVLINDQKKDGETLVKESKGCQAEITRAKINDMKIEYYNYYD